MRVNAGLAKGRRLKAVKGMETRPTSDKVKLALFNILGARVVDSFFLDLFAGTGAVAIEALSRGARFAYLIDNRSSAVGVIRDNLVLTGLTDKASVIRQDALKALAGLSRDSTVFDIIFVDPPYDSGLVLPVLEGVVKGRLLAGDGVLVVESRTGFSLPQRVEELECFRSTTYGDTTLNFYRFTS